METKKTTRNCCSLLRYKKERKRLRHAKDHETSPMDDALARDDGNARAPTTTRRSDHHPAREKPKNRFVKKKKEVVRPPLNVFSRISLSSLCGGHFSKTKRTHFPDDDTSKKEEKNLPRTRSPRQSRPTRAAPSTRGTIRWLSSPSSPTRFFLNHHHFRRT